MTDFFLIAFIVLLGIVVFSLFDKMGEKS